MNVNIWSGTFKSDLYGNTTVQGNIMLDLTNLEDPQYIIAYRGFYRNGQTLKGKVTVREKNYSLTIGEYQTLTLEVLIRNEMLISGSYVSENPRDVGTFKLTPGLNNNDSYSSISTCTIS